MGVDTTKASDHKSTNDLDKHDDGSVDTGGAYIGLRATNMKIENPPDIGDHLTLVIKTKCIGDGHQLMADGELRPKRTLKVEWVGPAGSKPPTEQTQTGMFDTNGQVTPQAAGEDDDDEDDELDTDEDVVDAEVVPDDEGSEDTSVEFSDGGEG